MSLNFSPNYISIFRRRYCSYYFATERQLIRNGFDLLKGVYSTSFHNFDLRPGVQVLKKKLPSVDCKNYFKIIFNNSI